MSTIMVRSGFVAGALGSMMMVALAGAVPLGQPGEAGREMPVSVRIIEPSFCRDKGIQARVEIVNRTDGPFRFQVCPGLKLSCVKDSHVFVNFADTGVGLLDPCNGGKEPEAFEVYLVKGASYAYPLRIEPDALPVECLQAGGSVRIQIGVLVGLDAWCYSDEAPIALSP